MSAESENVGILRQAYEAWESTKGADTECWSSIIADDARLTSLADGVAAAPFSRKWSGRSEIIEYLNDLTSSWEMNYYHID